MRAVTWTQVAQYLIMILAYLVPVIWLSVKQTGWPVPQLHLGTQLQIVAEREQALMRDPAELQVQGDPCPAGREAARKLQDVPAALSAEQSAAAARLQALKASDAPLAQIQAAEKHRRPAPHLGRGRGTLAPRAGGRGPAAPNPWAACSRHAKPFAGDPAGSSAEQGASTIRGATSSPWCCA